MSNLITLDSLRDAVEKEFAPVKIDLGGEVVTLRNLLRLPEKQRLAAFELIDTLQTDDESTASVEKSAKVALEMLRLVADDDTLGALLIESIQDDLPLTMKIFEEWMAATQLGEAGNSPDS